MGELEEIPVSLEKDPIFKKLFEIAEVSNLTPAEMNAYQQSLKIKRDNYVHDQNVLNQGIEQGKAKGRHEEALEIAREMRKDKFSIETIAKLTKLPIEEIEAL